MGTGQERNPSNRDPVVQLLKRAVDKLKRADNMWREVLMRGVGGPSVFLMLSLVNKETALGPYKGKT